MNTVEKVRQLLERKGLDGVLINQRSNFSWLTGGRENYIANGTQEGVASLYITPSEQYVIASSIEMPRILDEEVGQLGYQPMEFPWYEPWLTDTFPGIIGDKRIGSDALMLSDGWVNISAELSAVRSVLDPMQIEQYRSVAQLGSEAIEEVCRLVEPGWTEQEIRAEVARSAHRRNLNPTVILIATDERIYKYRHPIATEKRLEKYAMIVICAERYGLVSNSTRFVHFGPLSDELEEKSQKVAHIDAALIAHTKPGVSYTDFFAILQSLYADSGYAGEWKLHHQGGLTGFAPREFTITPHTQGHIQLNQAFAWNPSITGAKSEDTIIVTSSGTEILSATKEWPTYAITSNGTEWKRPAILMR